MIAHRTIVEAGRVVAGLGFLTVLLDVVLGLRPPATETVTVVEGVPFAGSISVEPIAIEPSIAAGGALQQITARVRTPGGDELTLTGRDAADIGDYEVRTLSVGLAPEFAVRRRGGARAVLDPIPLGVWRPERAERSFRLPGVAATAWARYYPDFALGPSGPTSRSMAERDPVLALRLEPDHPTAPSGRALLRPGDAFSFGPELELELVALPHWGELTLTERHRHAFGYLGLILIALGWIGRLVARRIDDGEDRGADEG